MQDITPYYFGDVYNDVMGTSHDGPYFYGLAKRHVIKSNFDSRVKGEKIMLDGEDAEKYLMEVSLSGFTRTRSKPDTVAIANELKQLLKDAKDAADKASK